MTAAILLQPLCFREFDNNGNPLAFGTVTSYQAGTTTQTPTYTDSTAVTANPNPLTLNARGEAQIWTLPNVSYKFLVQDSTGNTIRTVDNVQQSQLLSLYGGVDSGAANAYILTFAASFNSYVNGIIVYWLPSNSNTGASTININGLGVVGIVNQDGSALQVGQIIANQICGIIYSGSGFVLLSTAFLPVTINKQNANYTFALSDANNIVLHGDSNPYTYTIPQSTSVDYEIGTRIEILNQGSGTITVSPAAGVALFAYGILISGNITLTAGISCTIVKTAVDSWQQAASSQNLPTQLSAFTGTLTGVTATITGSVLYRQTGHLVTLYLSSAITGTSNSTAMALTGMPAAARPPNVQVVASVNMEDNGATVGGTASVATGGTVTFGAGINGNTSGFTSSGTKGLQAGWTITYCVT